VEEKGYKNMINLPDWLNIHNKIIKFENRLETGELFADTITPFSKKNRNDMQNPV